MNKRVAILSLLWPVCCSLSMRHVLNQNYSFQTPNRVSSTALSSNKPPVQSFDEVVFGRYACKHFQRYDGQDSGPTASYPDPSVIHQVIDCLNLARLAPSSFNSQPYKIILVSSIQHKTALSKYCLGVNADRIRDSDCTAIFLADRQVLRSMGRLTEFLDDQPDKLSRKAISSEKIQKGRRCDNSLKLYIGVFSSGLGLPRWIAGPITFVFRSILSFLSLFTRPFYPLPTLSSAETWTTKQVMLVAMTYMLACSARGLSTIPMEGICAPGIRNVLGIPSRFSIPLVICTGRPTEKEAHRQADVVNARMNRRYPSDEVIYGDTFGAPLRLLRRIA